MFCDVVRNEGCGFLEVCKWMNVQRARALECLESFCAPRSGQLRGLISRHGDLDPLFRAKTKLVVSVLEVHCFVTRAMRARSQSCQILAPFYPKTMPLHR